MPEATWAAMREGSPATAPSGTMRAPAAVKSAAPSPTSALVRMPAAPLPLEADEGAEQRSCERAAGHVDEKGEGRGVHDRISNPR